MVPVRPIDRWFINEVLPHESRYLALARRLSSSRDEAHDLVQEAYARLFATDGWSAIDNPPGYLLRTIRHVAIERMRRAKIINFQQLIEAEHGDVADDMPDAFDIAAGRDRLKRFSEALGRLPERCRDVFVRRRVRGQTQHEVSKELGVSISTLEKRLARAFFLLAQQGVGSPDDTPHMENELVADIAHDG